MFTQGGWLLLLLGSHPSSSLLAPPHLQPVQVLHEVLHAVDQPPVRSVLQLGHDVVEGDEVADVQGHVVVEDLRGGVQVDDLERALLRRAVRLQLGAVRGLIVGERAERRAERAWGRRGAAGQE